MRDFFAQRFNLLLCSTIIETGIDVPTANTIVINRADQFGLAQLHQLRGRVGRSHHQAYAYLLVPDVAGPDHAGRAAAGGDPADGGPRLGLLPRDARPRDPRRRRGAGREPERQDDGGRLPALHRHAGRGRARAEGRPRARPAGAAARRTTEINLHAPALLPDAYCSDVHTRLVLYKRLATRRASPSRSTRCWRRSSTASASCRRRARRCSTRTACACWPSPTAWSRSTPAPKLMVHQLPPEPAGRRADASSSWCRRTATSSWPATTSCASSARSPSRATARSSCATCCARSGTSGGGARMAPRRRPMNATEHAPGLLIRGFTPPLRLADFKLVAFDMDSTLINIECVDEIADVAGRKAEVAAITEAAMRGEIADYKDSLRRRVALLARRAGRRAASRSTTERLQLNPGVRGLRARLPGGRAEDAAGLAAASPSSATASATAWRSTSRAPTCWASTTAGSPARCSTGPGATSSTAPRRAACCSRCAS